MRRIVVPGVAGGVLRLSSCGLLLALCSTLLEVVGGTHGLKALAGRHSVCCSRCTTK